MPYEGVQAGPPPRSGAGTRATASAQRAPEKKLSKKAEAREEAANGIGQLLSFGAMAAGWLPDAGAIGNHWPAIAHEAAAVAETDEKLAKGLDYLLEVGPYGNLIVATLPLVAQLLVNHGILKAEAMGGAGVVHPETLTVQVQAHLTRTHMAALQQQREAEAELAAMQAEMNAHANGRAPQEEAASA